MHLPFRPVKIYFNKTTLKTSSKSQDFNELLNLILGNKGQQLIEDLSYIPLDQAELNNIKTNNRAILIGVGVPLDGTYTDLSKSIINAVKLAAEQLNEAGGIDSRDIEIITCNDESRVDQGLVCAQKFIDAGVTAVIGHLNSQVSIETSKLYVEHQIPMITAASTHPWFTERPGARGFVFRTVGRDDKQAELLAKSISNLAIPHPAKVAIFNNSTVYGATLSSLIEAQIIGIAKDKVTAIKALQQGKNQYHNEVEALDAQVLVFVGEATDAAQLVKELALTNHKNIVFIGAEGIFSQRYIQEAGLRAEGTYVTGTILELGSKQLEDFENLYLEKFKTKPTAFALNAFDAMMILGQALKNSQTENIPLIDSIKKTNYSGITGQIMFNSIGDPIQPRMCLYQVKNAKFIKPRIVLLGAGLLNDVPIRELSEKFFEVILLDAFFLDSTLAQIKKYPNVKFISKDISKIENLTDLDFDHLVSLNILSQLLLKEESIAIKQQIINKHWGLLVGNTVRSKVILITDYLKQIFDRNNQKKLEESSLADYDIPQADRYWDWDLAPLGELDSNYSMMLKVLAKVL